MEGLKEHGTFDIPKVLINFKFNFFLIYCNFKIVNLDTLEPKQ